VKFVFLAPLTSTTKAAIKAKTTVTRFAAKTEEGIRIFFSKLKNPNLFEHLTAGRQPAG
jgi:hypothetical protein